MNTRNGFLAFVRKEALHILRDPRTMLIVLGIPVVQLLLFGFAISTEVNNIDFAVAAPHPSEAVRRVVERIAANDYFTFRGWVEAPRIDRVLRTGAADVVVVFADDFDRRLAQRAGGPAAGVSGMSGSTTADSVAAGGFMGAGGFMVTGGFTADGGFTAGGEEPADGAGSGRSLADGTAVQLVFDASNPNTASAGAGYLRSIFAGIAEEATAADLSAAAGVSGTAGIEMRLLYNPQMKSAYNFVPGIMGLLFILICSIMTSVSIVREKESGTMEVLLVSPVRPVWIVFAKMIPYFLLSCLDLALILLLARYVLGVPMSGSIAGIVAISVLYLLLALALGLFISTVANRQATALVISAMLMLLPVIMLSGMIFPVENMPRILQALSCVIPARWYIEAVRKLMIQALPFGAVLREFVILLAMTLALVGIALHKFNDKLE